MALEQMLAYLEDGKQSELGPTVETGMERFPMLESSELAVEHKLFTDVLSEFHESGCSGATIKGLKAVGAMCAGDVAHRTRCYQAALERDFAYAVGLSHHAEGYAPRERYLKNRNNSELLGLLIASGVDVEAILVPTLRWLGARRILTYDGPVLNPIMDLCETKFQGTPMPADVREALLAIRANMFDDHVYGTRPEIAARIDQWLGSGPWQDVFPGEIWSDHLLKVLESMPQAQRDRWLSLLKLCRTATGAKPNSKWDKSCAPLLDAVGKEQFSKLVLEVFSLATKGKTRPSIPWASDNVNDRMRIYSSNADILRGLLWCCLHFPSDEICRGITHLAISAYSKIRGLGPRALKVGNAALYVLGEMSSVYAVGQLAILKIRVKLATAQKGIETALTTTAERVGIAREELEEMSVPSYGLSEVGFLKEELGEVTVELKVIDSKCLMQIAKADGKPLKSMPAAVQKEFSDDCKELKQAVADIDKMIPAQSARMEQLYLQPREWDYPVWRDRYLDHPLVGTLARRLIWQFRDGDRRAAAIFDNGRLVNQNDEDIKWIADSTKVTLWHPLDGTTDDVIGWRDWLVAHRVKQPFKQAHREIYILTDAERATATYSNRFAAHILKQHQFNALCMGRGWKNKLRLMVDDHYEPAYINLPQWNLRAEYWVEGTGDDSDINETGTYWHLVTDQVRFYSINSAHNHAHAGGRGGYTSTGTDREENHPLALPEIPALVFSEVMRDVDLFVGVSSVAHDPNWSDGGPGGRYREYWHSHSFGELGVSAQLRKAFLESIMPKLKIADRCSFTDRFLIVRGDIRTYKIHLGSSNILMEPDDQYLCIVPKQAVGTDDNQVFLPFEGDNMLSAILSKTFLLAADAKIKDASITSQLKLKARAGI